MIVSTAGQIAWYLNIAATLSLIVHLRWNGLHRIYHYFFWYLLADFTQQALMLLVQRQRLLSARIYMGGQAVKMILAVFVVMQLYQFALAAQPAMARYGRRTVGVVLVVSGGIAALIVSMSPVVGPLRSGGSPVLYYFLASERAMDSAVLFFLLAVSVFMIWFPVRVPKNVAIYIGGFVAYFFSRWGSRVLIVFGHRAELDLAMLSVSFICLATWIVFLRKEGESKFTVTGHLWNLEEADRLTGQLAAFNGKLEEFSGK